MGISFYNTSKPFPVYFSKPQPFFLPLLVRKSEKERWSERETVKRWKKRKAVKPNPTTTAAAATVAPLLLLRTKTEGTAEILVWLRMKFRRKH